MGRRIDVRTPSPLELELLVKASKGKDYELRTRSRAILLSLEPKSRATVAAMLGLNRKTVTFWVRRFNE